MLIVSSHSADRRLAADSNDLLLFPLAMMIPIGILVGTIGLIIELRAYRSTAFSLTTEGVIEQKIKAATGRLLFLWLVAYPLSVPVIFGFAVKEFYFLSRHRRADSKQLTTSERNAGKGRSVTRLGWPDEGVMDGAQQFEVLRFHHQAGQYAVPVEKAVAAHISTILAGIRAVESTASPGSGSLLDERTLLEGNQSRGLLDG